uniref:Type I phosphodiesterase/nucleotide pyrophosphatase n=1 Tax=Solibacter usitatus (strain Ellin6076) TaxID=234267 RepID=Q023T8_SOLUE
MKRLLVMGLLAGAAFARQPLLVISVDGLDQRYLAHCDEMKLKIPNLRRLMREGQWSRGVIGVMPTITWPSHTTILTGVDPKVHGVLSNRKPAAEGGDYPWSAKLLKARTLLDAAHEAGLKTAAITWPVTVDAPASFNLPEYFQRRRGGAMDLRSIESKAVPADLVTRIAGMFPSFAQEWMDDRTRTQAVVSLLRAERPDLLVVHLVDLDSEEHDNAPFSRESNAILEYTDELIGRMLEALAPGSAVALVSDHGFEKVEMEVNLAAFAAEAGVAGVRPMGSIAVAETEPSAEFVRTTSRDPRYGIGRVIPKDEVARFAPQFESAAAVFESAPGFLFASGNSGEVFSKPRETGNHGHWPMRYRSVYVLWGAGIAPANLPEFSLKEIAGKLAAVIDVRMP